METNTTISISTVKQELRLNKWAEQIKSQQSSGLTVQKWCAENGINDKTYYYRLLKVREQYIEDSPSIVPVSVPHSNDNTKGKIDPQDAADVAHFLWERTEIINDYLDQTDLSKEHREILKSWKRCISGEFIIERHLKKGSVFISTDDESVYMVSGIIDSWEEMLHGAPVPTVLKATLLPFIGVIITDGLVSVYPITFGSNSRAEFKEIYMDAKKSGKIKSSI